MRRLLGPVAAVAALLAPPAFAAEGVGPEAYVPALTVYVDALAAAHAAASACAPAGAAAHDEPAWQTATAVLTGTLSANGFPPAFLADITRRLAAAPAGAPDCAAAARFHFAYDKGWGAEIEHVLSGLELKPVSPPVTPEAWQAVRDAVVRETPLQGRMLSCLAVVQPDLLIFMVRDWDAMLVRIAGRLVAAGVPRDQVSALVGMAEANALWQPVPPDAAAILAKACADDESWQTRLATFGFGGLAGKIDALLPPPPDTDN